MKADSAARARLYDHLRIGKSFDYLVGGTPDGDADAVTDAVAEYTAGMLLSGLLCDAHGIDSSL